MELSGEIGKVKSTTDDTDGHGLHGDAEALEAGHRHDRDGGRDCVELMQLARGRVDVLEEALWAMGYSEANDNFPEGVERN